MSAGSQLDHAHAVCRGVTRRAARNFYYAFLVLPREKRDALCAVYAFMRHCDDLCDEPGVALAERRARLEAWRQSLHQVLAGQATDDPVLFALAEAQKRFQIPPQLFDQLVQGTAMDLPPAEAPPGSVLTFASFDELYDYCYHVASVVGLVTIGIFGYRDEERQQLSDATCTALQLANFWQDVLVDYGKGRIYLPLEDLRRFGVSEDDIAGRRATPAFLDLMRFEVERARQWFAQGLPLAGKVDRELALDVELFSRGGQEILNAIERQGYDVLRRRPVISRPRKLWLVARAFLKRLA